MTSVSKNVHINKLDDIINKYDNAYQSTIKMKLTDANSNTYIKLILKMLNLNLAIT